MNNHFMQFALKHAKASSREGEVPVGAVIVRRGEVISFGRNRREKKQNALLHAEIEAIDKACKKIGYWRLDECDLYVTLEPCPMCAGAIINSRIKNLYIGATDPKNGAVGSVINLFDYPFTHKPDVYYGIMEEECGKILKNFFKGLRG